MEFVKTGVQLGDLLSHRHPSKRLHLGSNDTLRAAAARAGIDQLKRGVVVASAKDRFPFPRQTILAQEFEVAIAQDFLSQRSHR